MSIEGLVRVQVERAHRVDIDGLGTLTVRSQLPAMVQIVNLSRTGCLFKSTSRPEIGAKISVGIPGIGSLQAIVMRSDPDGVGCAFLAKLREKDVDRARSARTLDRGEASAAVRRLRRSISEREDEKAPTWLERLRGTA